MEVVMIVGRGWRWGWGEEAGRGWRWGWGKKGRKGERGGLVKWWFGIENRRKKLNQKRNVSRVKEESKNYTKKKSHLKNKQQIQK